MVLMSLLADYECDGCGACCQTFPIFAAEADTVREPRIAQESRKLPDSLGSPSWRYQLYPLPFHQSCCFLDHDQRCTIYPTRPDVCRKFEAGSQQCHEARERLGIAPLVSTRVS